MKLLLSLIVLLSFSGCSTKYINKCPKLTACVEPLELHINDKGGLDSDNTLKAIKWVKSCKKTAIIFNKDFTKWEKDHTVLKIKKAYL